MNGNPTQSIDEGRGRADAFVFYDNPREWVNTGVTWENLAGEYFIFTVSDKYMLNVTLDPEDCLFVVEIAKACDSYRIVWGLKNGGGPTSEFPNQFMNHSVRVAATDSACHVIYHAHLANVSALTYVLPLTARDFSRALWKNAAGCPVVLPGGIVLVPWMVLGGADIALTTCEKI